jgi:hypothetical protein
MRVLTCIDATPNPDGSCATSAYVEIPSWTDTLPTIEDAQSVGFHMFASLAILAAMALLLPPRSITDD